MLPVLQYILQASSSLTLTAAKTLNRLRRANKNNDDVKEEAGFVSYTELRIASQFPLHLQYLKHAPE
eukprot:IDg2209t1